MRCIVMYSPDTGITPEEATSKLTSELAKPKDRQDRALLLKMSRTSFQLRRDKISQITDGAVRTLLKEVPILEDPHFVSSIQMCLMYFLMQLVLCNAMYSTNC